VAGRDCDGYLETDDRTNLYRQPGSTAVALVRRDMARATGFLVFDVKTSQYPYLAMGDLATPSQIGRLVPVKVIYAAGIF